MSVSDTDAAAIRAVMDSYQAAWAANDPAALEAHWDTDDPAPFYKPEEIAEPYLDWDGVRAYWAHNEQFHDTVRLTLTDPRYKPMADGLVMVAWHMRWDILFDANARGMDGIPFHLRGRAIGGDNTVVTVFRKLGDDWKLTAWSETPMAPITYIGQLYEKDVSPGFPKSVD